MIKNIFNVKVMFYFLISMLLALNYFAAYNFVFVTGITASIIYNAVKFGVYIYIGWFGSYRLNQSNISIFMISSMMFIYEHVLLKIVHLQIINRRENLIDGLGVILGSFVFVLPVILLLTYIGIKTKILKRL